MANGFGEGLTSALEGISTVTSRAAEEFSPDPRARLVRRQARLAANAQRDQRLQSQLEFSLRSLQELGKLPAQAFGTPGVQKILQLSTEQARKFATDLGVDPGIVDQAAQLATQQSAANVPEGQAVTLSPGQVRFQQDAEGNLVPVAAVPGELGPIEQKVESFRRVFGRDPDEREAQRLFGVADPKDPFKSVIRNGQPTLVRESEVDPAIDQPIIAGLDIEFTPEGGLRVRQGPQGLRERELTAAQAQEQQERIGFFRDALGQIDDLLALPQGSLGAVGTIKRGVREVARVGEEIAGSTLPEDLKGPLSGLIQATEGAIGLERDQGLISDEVAALLEPDELSFASIAEARLAYIVARTLQPTGRLLKDSVQTAKDQTRLFGFRSETTVRERLNVLRSQLDDTLKNIEGPTESPTTGEPTTEDLGGQSTEDLLQQLLRALQGGEEE